MIDFHFFIISLPDPISPYPPENPNPFGDFEDDIDY